jgi:hypothetical protein
MKSITEIVSNYDVLVESFEVERLIDVRDNDWQGSSYYVLRENEKYGILVFGWGSCSGCDSLEAITDHYYNGKNEETIIKELNEFRDNLYNSITWRPREEMIDYVSTKDFGLEWYGHADGGRKFVEELKSYFFIDRY